MRVFAPSAFRYPPQVGVDYPAGWQDMPQAMADTLLAAGYVETQDSSAAAAHNAVQRDRNSNSLPNPLDAAAVRKVGPRIRLVASHGNAMSPSTSVEPSTTQSNGTTQTSATNEHMFTYGCDARDVRFLICNGVQNATGYIVANGNALQVHAALLPNGGGNEMSEISFPGCLGAPISADPNGGKTAYAIGDKATVWSAPVNYSLQSAGKQQSYRIHVKVSAGQKWPLTPTARYNSGASKTTDVVYRTTAGDGTDWSGSNAGMSSAYAFGASALSLQFAAVIGEQVTAGPTVLVIGDSIGGGIRDDVVGRGFVVRACEAAGAIVHNSCLPGSSFGGYYSFGTIARDIAPYVDHIFCHTGVNGWSSGSMTYVADDTTQSGIRYQMIQLIKAMCRPGQTITFSTQLPFPNGTGAGAGTLPAGDYAQQRPNNQEAARISINNWMRDRTANGMLAWAASRFPGITVRVFDGCLTLERHWNGTTATPITLDGNGQQVLGNGGYILINSTFEGLHPNTLGNQLLGDALAAQNLFTL